MCQPTINIVSVLVLLSAGWIAGLLSALAWVVWLEAQERRALRHTPD